MSWQGYALSVAGCPYLFTSGPLTLRECASSGAGTALTSDEQTARPWWFYDASLMGIAEGFLDVDAIAWAETAKPLDGDLDMGAQTFRLHDARADGHDLVTWLATRFADDVTSSPLASSVSSSATTWTVGHGATFSVDSFVWCERECARVTAVSGNDLTVARAQLGTRAVAHAVDDAAGRLPLVFRDLPWITRRRVVLWGIDSDGTPEALWCGYAVRSPRLAQDGVRYDLPCDSLWQVLSQGPLGETVNGCALVGYGRTGRSGLTTAGDSLLRAAFHWTSGGTDYTIAATAQGAFRDWSGVVRAFTTSLDSAAAALSLTLRSVARRNGSNVTFLFEPPVNPVNTSVIVLGKSYSSSYYRPTIEADGVPRVGYIVVQGTQTTWCVSTLTGLPSSWATEVTNTVDGYATVRNVGLRVAVSKDLYVGVQGITTDGIDGPRVTGIARVYPRAVGVATPDLVIISDPPPLQVYREVSTEHWAYGIRYALLDLVADSDGANDFDWNRLDELVAITGGLTTARTWILDGRRTLGSIVLECCQLFGCSPVVRRGRLALWPWRWPDANDEPVHAYGTADIIGDPTWQTWDEGLANRVEVKSESVVVDATVADSVARYGPGRRLQTALAGVEDQGALLDDPIAFSRAVLSRVDLWAYPLGVVRFVVPFTPSNHTVAQIGNLITFTDWLVPNGAGGRGMSGATGSRCIIVGRAPDIGRGTIEITALVFPRLSYGYAPCVRVGGRTGTTVLRIASAYVEASTSYADTGTLGAEHFRHADAVELVLRDDTSDVREAAVVFAVNLGASPPTIELDSPMSSDFQGYIDAGCPVDLRFAHYASTAQWQRGWMYVGAESTQVIDSTEDRARRIAP